MNRENLNVAFASDYKRYWVKTVRLWRASLRVVLELQADLNEDYER